MSDALDRIEAILADIERLDAASRGQFREPEDREAFDIASRIERKMQQAFVSHVAADRGTSQQTTGAPDA